VSDATAAEWLLEEALDHLERDTLGVYELLCLLRGSDYDLEDEQAKALARQTVAALVTDGKARVVRLRWPTNEEIDAAVDPSAIEEDTAFESTETGAYLALVPPDTD